MRILILTILLIKPVYAQSFLVFGDSGYHEDFQKKKEIDGVSLEDWKAEAIEDGDVLGGKAILPPLAKGNIPGLFIEKSGAPYVGRAMANYCKRTKCDFAIVLGDNIYPNGAEPDNRNKERFHKMLYLPWKNIQRNNRDFRFYAALGNHDWKISKELEYAEAMVRKRNSLRGARDQITYMARKDNRWVFNPSSDNQKRKTYYKFTRGEADFFVIDTDRILAAMLVQDDDEPKKYKPPEAPETIRELYYQMRWLKKSLEDSKAKWKIVYGHHTLWSVGGTKHYQAMALRNAILKRLCQYADMYIAGHEHDLEFHMEPCGKGPVLPLIVSGAASKMRSVGLSNTSKMLIKTQRETFRFAKGMTWGFAHISFINNKAQVNFLSVDKKGRSKLVYKATLKKRLP
ncbi:MAG: hypothetical protein E2O68_04020 [Deltaproteobacteria bacterium]|nr:MAG: hypothetical protein E2O68_04020 [Deltaproteobacteria bacterium]